MLYKLLDLLNEMAFKRAELLFKINNMADVIIEHLIKVYLYPKHDSCNHWIKEVTYNILKIGVKTKGGRLKYKDYFTHLFLKPLTNKVNYSKNYTIDLKYLKSITDLIISDYETRDYYLEGLAKFIEEVMVEISIGLSKNILNRYIIFSIIKRLLKMNK